MLGRDDGAGRGRRWPPVKRAGAKVAPRGAFKPRSSPYSFQGLGEPGLVMLRDAADRHDLKLISEVMDISQIELIGKYADIFQVGARNMQNFTLLRELGRARKPVMLKRGISATIEEWLLSAEYILAGGNSDVILCERGIRTFETATRNTFDVSAIPVVKKLSHLPIVAGPEPRRRAARHGGADGARGGGRGRRRAHHRGAPRSDRALSDGAQSMFPAQFDRADGRAAHHRARPSAASICVDSPRPPRLDPLGQDPGMREASLSPVAIAGIGLIGGSMALAMRDRWPSADIAASTRRRCDARAHSGAIDEGLRRSPRSTGGPRVLPRRCGRTRGC
jgi:3-deoxy-7-phosphoheptulonate synthase